MGVQIYLLNRRKVSLLVDGVPQRIGTISRFWKVTEIDSQRAAEMDALEADHRGKPGPVAVMTAYYENCTLATSPERIVAAHLVLGWEIGRTTTTDWNWDYLPVLGYAVQNDQSRKYTLYEKRDGLLFPLAVNRGVELDILNRRGKLIRRGQPSIIYCRYVQPYISTYAEAKCVLNDGNTVDLLTSVEPGHLPDVSWYVGKRPGEVREYH